MENGTGTARNGNRTHQAEGGAEAKPDGGSGGGGKRGGGGGRGGGGERRRRRRTEHERSAAQFRVQLSSVRLTISD